MKKHKGIFSLKRMSSILQVSTSGYYSWLKRGISKRQLDELVLLDFIRSIFEESRKLYGAKKIFEKLKQIGFIVSYKRVCKIMRKYSIKPMYIKAFKVRTTNSNHRFPYSANLVKRNFQADKPNRLWVSDITYIATNQGWLYLCTIIDIFSRKIVGFSMDVKVEAALVINAFKMAYQSRDVEDWKLIFHSDRGSQFSSYTFREVLYENKVISSMSRTGDCYDNALAESWFGLMKREMLYLLENYNITYVKNKIFEYMMVFYNKQRIHSGINYMTPEQYELKVA